MNRWTCPEFLNKAYFQANEISCKAVEVGLLLIEVATYVLSFNLFRVGNLREFSNSCHFSQLWLLCNSILYEIYWPWPVWCSTTKLNAPFMTITMGILTSSISRFGLIPPTTYCWTIQCVGFMWHLLPFYKTELFMLMKLYNFQSWRLFVFFTMLFWFRNIMDSSFVDVFKISFVNDDNMKYIVLQMINFLEDWYIGTTSWIYYLFWIKYFFLLIYKMVLSFRYKGGRDYNHHNVCLIGKKACPIILRHTGHKQ